jgi:hypothetical protein
MPSKPDKVNKDPLEKPKKSRKMKKEPAVQGPFMIVKKKDGNRPVKIY